MVSPRAASTALADPTTAARVRDLDVTEEAANVISRVAAAINRTAAALDQQKDKNASIEVVYR